MKSLDFLMETNSKHFLVCCVGSHSVPIRFVCGFFGHLCPISGFPRGSQINPPASTGDVGSIPGLGRCLEKEIASHCNILYYLSHQGSPLTHSSILTWKSHGQRSLVGYSPWGLKSQTKLSDSAPPPTAPAIPDPNSATFMCPGESALVTL